MFIHHLDERHIDEHAHYKKKQLKHGSLPAGCQEPGKDHRHGPWNRYTGTQRNQADAHAEVGYHYVDGGHQHERNEYHRVQQDRQSEYDGLIDAEQAWDKCQFSQLLDTLGTAEKKHCDQQRQRGAAAAEGGEQILELLGYNIGQRLACLEGS